MTRLVRVKREDSELPVFMQNVEVTLDPSGEFKGYPERAVIESMGLIPWFIAEAAGTYGLLTPRDVAEVLLEAYAFGTDVDYNMLEGEGHVDKNGTYTYPGDPTLEPLAAFKFKNQPFTVYVYRYALVAVVHNDYPDIQWMGRFD